jgi:hypothetical protein
MRHFSLFDDMGDEPISIPDEHLGWHMAADDDYFTIDLGTESGVLGLIDILGWVNKNVNPMDSEGSNVENIEELLNYVNDLYNSRDFVLRINSDQFEKIKDAFEIFMSYADTFQSRDEFENANPDLEIEDIWQAEDRLWEAEMDPSSGKGLENIPTMEKNPEDLEEGESPMGDQTEDIFGKVPELSEAPEYNPEPEARPSLFEGWGYEQNPAPDMKIPSGFRQWRCPACDGWLSLDNDGDWRCNQCNSAWADTGYGPDIDDEDEWDDIPHSIPPATPAGQINMLEKQFNMPAVEHPLGPHTGAESLDNQYYTIPIDKNGNELNSADIFFQWAEAYELLPEEFLNSNIVSRDEQGNPVFRFSGSEYSQMIQACNAFVSLSTTNLFQLFNSLFASETVYTMLERSKIFDGAIGMDPSEIMAEAGKMSQEQLQQMLTQLTEIMQPIVLDILNFIKKVTSIKPDSSSQANLENAFNAPTVKHPVEKPLGPDEGLDPRIGANGEEYFGRFISLTGWSRPVWAVLVELDEGQTPPQSGDMVTVTRDRNYPSKVILTDRASDTKNIWNFKQYNAVPEPEPVQVPEGQGGREVYTSGGFVKGPDGKWLVAIRAAGGQRPPEPGDWAQIVQRSTGNRPVPLTLVEDMGAGWSFKNGHHPSI